MRMIFDSHLHIIDPRFPLVENHGFLPEPFLSKDYQERVRGLNIQGGAVVSGSFQGYDQTYLLEALHQLGKNFVGVTQLPHDTTDEEIVRLHGCGVRALRFNVKRGGSEDISRLDSFARRVFDLVGWHAELYIDSVNIPEIAGTLGNLPAVSIDHLGLSAKGFSHLLALVEKGVRVKASGFGRGDLDIVQAVRSVCAANPDALMFGTDLPSTRAPRPFLPTDIELIIQSLSQDQADKVLFRNARDWYHKG